MPNEQGNLPIFLKHATEKFSFYTTSYLSTSENKVFVILEFMPLVRTYISLPITHEDTYSPLSS